MNVKKIMIAGIIIWLVDSLFGWLTCGWLFNWIYTLPPNIWVAPAEMMASGNMIGANVVGIFRAMIFASVFAFLYRGLPGEGVKKGMNYGFIVWLVGTLSGIASMPFYMTIAAAVVMYWIVQGLVLALIDGAIVGAIYKQTV